MNIREFYESSGVDYDIFLQRMMGREALVEKYIRLFIADPTYTELAQAMASGNYEEAGMKAHTLKGIAVNLSLEKLSSLCMNMVSSMRSGSTQELVSQFEDVKAEYMYIMEELGR